MDVGLVVTKSNPKLLNKLDLTIDRSHSIGHVESSNSPFDQQVNDPDEFDFSFEFFNSCDIEFALADSISLVDFFSPSEVDLTDYKPSSLGTIEKLRTHLFYTKLHKCE